MPTPLRMVLRRCHVPDKRDLQRGRNAAEGEIM